MTGGLSIFAQKVVSIHGVQLNKQKSLDSMIENGHEWMEPLAELRHELKMTQESEMWPKIRQITRRNGRVDLKNDGSDYTPGPYTLEFRKQYLKKLLEGQVKVQEHDPDMILISEDEIHEIQRIWRMEQGDWQNTAYSIYQNVTGTMLKQTTNDAGSFGQDEQKLLEQVCTKHDIPYKLVSNLLNSELELQSGSNHSKIFDKIRKELSKEWRDNIDEIRVELFAHRDQENEVRIHALD